MPHTDHLLVNMMAMFARARRVQIRRTLTATPINQPGNAGVRPGDVNAVVRMTGVAARCDSIFRFIRVADKISFAAVRLTEPRDVPHTATLSQIRARHTGSTAAQMTSRDAAKTKLDARTRKRLWRCLERTERCPHRLPGADAEHRSAPALLKYHDPYHLA